MMTATPGVMTLTIPCAAEHVRLARLLAGGLATQSGFDIDAVEDVRIAVDECCHALIGDHDDPGASITLTCAMTDTDLRIEGRSSRRGEQGASPIVEEFSATILETVVDDYQLFCDEDGPGFVIRKRVPHGA